MMKTAFYSMVREDGENIAKLHQGSTDGTYNYYKTGSTWHAIHPVNGLSICNGTTKKDVTKRAHEPQIVERIAAALARQQDAAERFAAAVKKAKEAI